MHLSAPVRNWLESLLGFIGLEAQTLTLPTDHNPIIDIGGDKNRMNKLTCYRRESGGFPEIKVGQYEVKVGQMTKE